MDSKQIEQLLEKYWSCETTLEEERQLRNYFCGMVPENLKEVAELFRYFEWQQQHQIAGAEFDQQVRRKLISPVKEGRQVKWIYNVAKIAAGLLVVITATYFVRQEVRKAYPPEIADTYSDPKLALEETKKALMMISKSLNKAQKEAEKIKVFNEAELKLQGKDTREETEQKKI
jgi:hypothetical protein